MIGAFFEINRRGRITSVSIIGNTETDAEVVQQALARVTRPGAWSWLWRLLRFRPLPSGGFLTDVDRATGAPR
jgi:hypothetical protein